MSAKRLPSRQTKSAEAVQRTVAPAISPTVMAATKTETFEGPVPHPDILAKYDHIVPGAAERIIQMAENEQRVRHESIKADTQNKSKLLEIARADSEANRTAVSRGQIIGGIISLVCIGAAIFCAVSGKSDLVVCGFLAVPTASLISAFFPKSKTTKKEEKNQ